MNASARPDFRAIFERAPELQLVLAPDLTIIAVSDAYLRATKTTRPGILGRLMFEVFPDNPDDPTASGVRNLRASLDRVRDSRAPDTIPPQKYDIRQPDAEGGGFEERWWSPINWPIVTADGQLLHIVHRVEDISELVAASRREADLGVRAEAMAAEVALKRQDLDAAIRELRIANEARVGSEEKFRAIFEQAAVGIGRLRLADKQWIDANDAFGRMLDRSPDTIVGRRWPELTHPDDVGREQHLLEQLAAGVLESYTIDKRFLRPGNEPLWTRTTCSLVRSASGAPDFKVSIIEDITEQIRAQAALRAANDRLMEADRRKDEFLATLSHELRNPLAPIRNALYLLDHADAASETAQRAKQVANRQLAHLTRLVEELLDVTRIIRGKVELCLQPVDLEVVVRQTVTDYSDLMREHELEVTTQCASGSLIVNGDEERLVQIVGNLLSNAAKFTPPGGRVAVELLRRDQCAVLRVRDTGVGIAQHLLPTIFDPFTQSGQSLARSRGGLGLGLSMVKGLTELHQGRVTAASHGEGTGAEFEVELPLQRPSYVE